MDRAICFDNIGNVSYHWGHYSLALRCFERAMEIREKALGLKHVDTAISWNNAGCCLDCLNRPQEANYRFHLAITCMKPELHVQHPRTTTVLRNLERMKRKPKE